MAAASKQKVLVSQPIHEAGMRVLTEKFEARVASDASEATLVREVRDCAGMLVRTAPIPASVIEAAPVSRSSPGTAWATTTSM
jgi:D-3-phosphoglycerate dehydrogenase